MTRMDNSRLPAGAECATAAVNAKDRVRDNAMSGTASRVFSQNAPSRAHLMDLLQKAAVRVGTIGKARPT